MLNYFIRTFGCQMNISDSERLASFLESYGFQPNTSMEKADLVIFNTCGVRQTAENSAMGLIHNLKEKNSSVSVVLTGCLANRQDVQKKLKDKVNLFFPINHLDQFENWIIKNYLKKTKITTDKINLLQQKNLNCLNNYLSIIPKYNNPLHALVPIMTGCNNFCSYCVVPYARGREISRSKEEIFKEIKNLSQNNCQKITLLGQNVNSYRWQTIDFPQLLETLAQTFPLINFNFLTSHPKDFSEQLMKIIARYKNINKEIHLPIQSGSDKILQLMNRPYNQKHYLDLIKKAKKIIPEVSFTTDVIVGFPQETEEDFLQTVKVFQAVSFTRAYINKYSPRPNTAAFALGDPISWKEKKEREKKLRNVLKSSLKSSH